MMFRSLRRPRGPAAPRPARPRNARLLVQCLENRVVPATFTVLNNADNGPGSLRQALLSANALAGADAVEFDAAYFATPRTVTLAGGELQITDSVSVNGPGAARLIVNGNGTGRAFDIDGPGQIAVALQGLTITGGRLPYNVYADGGGGVRVADESLAVADAVVTGNVAAYAGGGIYFRQTGSLSVVRSTVSGNSAGGRGGGVYMRNGGSLVVQDSTVSGNSAVDIGGGVLFYGTISAGGVAVVNSTFSGNTAFEGGGFMGLTVTGVVGFFNSTVTANTATTPDAGVGRGGGGICVSSFVNSQSSLQLYSTVVARNVAANGNSDIAAPANRPVVAQYSAVNDPDGWALDAGSSNNVPFNANPDLTALLDAGGPTLAVLPANFGPLYNAGYNFDGVPFDQRGPGFPRAAAGAPDIGATELSFGGVKPTAAADPADVTAAGGTALPLVVHYTVRSSAIDESSFGTGDIRVTGPNDYDQNATFVGFTAVPGPFGPIAYDVTYAVPPPGGTFDGTDFGNYVVAVEANQVVTGSDAVKAGVIADFLIRPPATFVVRNADDAGAGSLRQALVNANAFRDTADTVTFDPTFFAVPRTIGLTTGHLVIIGPAVVLGPGADRLTVSGGGLSRVFDIGGPGVFSETLPVTLTDLRIRDGRAPVNTPSGGGGVRSSGQPLTLERVVVEANAAPNGVGGGISVESRGVLTLRDSTVSGNSAGSAGGSPYYAGGGIFASGGGLVENSTVSGNSASSRGGGIFAVLYGGSDLTVSDSTISGNSTPGSGGGLNVVSYGGTVRLRNSTIALNSSGTATAAAGDGGGGIAVRKSTFVTAAAVAIESTIVAGNAAAAGNGRDDIAAGTGVSVTATRSALGDPDGFTLAAGSANNLAFGTALGLGPLADNGGPTRTHAFAPTSPLRDAGANPAGLLFDQRGAARVFGPAVDIGAVELQPAPGVAGVAVNAGQANATQRSRVTSIAVTFSTQVTFVGSVADAFNVSRIGGGTVGGFSATATVVNGVTVVTLTGFTGAETQSGSLADGRYSVTVRADQVTSFGRRLDGNGDGTAGDDFTLAGTTANGLFRLYGDVSGDGVINAFDFAQFRPAFGTSTGQAAYRDFLDANNDGTINAFDFAQFRTRFGSTVP